VLKDNCCYKLSNTTVRSFNGAKYLSLGENCRIEEIPNIGDVNETLEGIVQDEIVVVV